MLGLMGREKASSREMGLQVKVWASQEHQGSQQAKQITIESPDKTYGYCE